MTRSPDRCAAAPAAARRSPSRAPRARADPSPERAPRAPAASGLEGVAAGSWRTALPWPLALLLFLGTAACSDPGPVVLPEPLYGEVPIEYPLDLWDQGLEGETTVRVLVNEVGEVDSAMVAESSGHDGFDSAAVEGAMKLRFQPARRGEERIRVWARVPVQFSRKPRSDRIPPPDPPGDAPPSP